LLSIVALAWPGETDPTPNVMESLEKFMLACEETVTLTVAVSVVVATYPVALSPILAIERIITNIET
jgi:hypothetical protein